jgi:hypothetical protein
MVGSSSSSYDLDAQDGGKLIVDPVNQRWTRQKEEKEQGGQMNFFKFMILTLTSLCQLSQLKC